MFYLCGVSNGTDAQGYTIVCTLDEFHDGPHAWSGVPKRKRWWQR